MEDQAATTTSPFYERALDAEERAEKAERKAAALERLAMEEDEWKRRAERLREALRGIVSTDLSAAGMKSAARTILAANQWDEEER